jgi:hypothetical protein
MLRQYSVWLRAGRSGFDPRQGKRIFLPAPASRPALGLTQPLIQLVPGVLSPGVKRGRSVTLTTHPHLVLRSRMSRSYTSSLPNASMACSGTAYLTPIVPTLHENQIECIFWNIAHRKKKTKHINFITVCRSVSNIRRYDEYSMKRKGIYFRNLCSLYGVKPI